MTDADLNARLAKLLGVNPVGFDPVGDNRQCDPLSDRFDVDLNWSEGLWSAQIRAPDGRAYEAEDASATRAVVHAILAAHGGH